MNTKSKWTIALVLLSVTAYGQVPTANDTSDDNANTGMGTESLGGPAGFNQGFDNTAVGDQALRFSTTGSFNTATGAAALANNSTSSNNTATGYSAMIFNKVGADNTAVGYETLFNNDKPATGIANQNTAVGSKALFTNTTGSANTASGFEALFSNTTGSNNIAVGHQAGANTTTGSNNIEIGNVGTAGDNKVIKIGTEGTQKKTLIAGIFSNTAVSGLSVVVGSNGELGALSSSARFKTDIASMGSNTSKLDQLRPVTFHYKADVMGTLRYGLIAEEVAKVYPELVVRDTAGRIDGVRYDELSPMLLNEMQKEHATVASLVTQHEGDAEKIAVLEQKVAEVSDLKQQLMALFQELKTRDSLVAQR